MQNRTRAVLLMAPAAACVMASSPGIAQTPAGLTGVVRDTAGAPLAAVQVTSSGLRTYTDSAGRFQFTALPGGIVGVQVRRLGYEPRDTSVTLAGGITDSLLVVMAILPVDLPGMSTAAQADAHRRLADFYRHRASGQGYYFDRREIEERRVTRISDLLRRLPGIRMNTDRSGRGVLRMGRTAGGRDCPPDFWIDGIRAAGLNVDDLPLTDVEALEVYKGPSGLPPELNNRFGNPACGAVVIWTRLPG